MTNVAPCMNLRDWPLFEMPSTEETEDVHWSCLDRKGNNFSSSHFCGVKPIFPRPDKILLRFSVFASAVKRSIGFTIGFHNHGEGPY